MLTRVSWDRAGPRAIVVSMAAHPIPSIAIDDLAADIPAVLELLADTHPTIALALVRALDGGDTLALRARANRLLEALANDSRFEQEVDAIVSRSCIGVDAGNAPAWICADADVDRAARAIVAVIRPSSCAIVNILPAAIGAHQTSRFGRIGGSARNS